MNEKTVFEYENRIGKLKFAYNAAFWITDIDGVSSVEIDIAESRSPMQIGSSVTGQSVKPRSFTIDGAFFDPLDANRDRLLDILAPQIPATFTVIQNGESWYLDVIPEKTPEVTTGNGVQFFQTRLKAAYPYWRTTAYHATQIAGIQALFRFPFYTGGTWWISQFDGNYFKSVENNGNVPMEFTIVFLARGSLSNPEIYHVDTRQRISIGKDMVNGERVIISTVYGNRGVTCISPAGEVSNGFRYLSIDSDLSMALNPGANLLRIDAESNREALSARVEAPAGVKSGV